LRAQRETYTMKATYSSAELQPMVLSREAGRIPALSALGGIAQDPRVSCAADSASLLRWTDGCDGASP